MGNEIMERRLQVYDLDTGVYGFESKDPEYGLEVIRTFVHWQPPDYALGLQLTEVAHGEHDHRGLVLVSQVNDPDVHHTERIHNGDAIVGVFVEEGFRESTTGLDYDETMDVLQRAKHYAQSVGGTTLSLELNRLVKRGQVMVEVQDKRGAAVVASIQAKAGDNLRSLLMHHHTALYGTDQTALHRVDQPSIKGDCGGEGICGTCLVQVLEGMDHLNAVGPQESSMLRGRPESWRASCKTVVGADNQDGSTLRIRLHPWIPSNTDSSLHM